MKPLSISKSLEAMKYPLPLLLLLLSSCQPVPEYVKENKSKFIQVAEEVTQPIDLKDPFEILNKARENNNDGKMKYLGVKRMEIHCREAGLEGFDLDSVLLFYKSNYIILYDFARIKRNADTIRTRSWLRDFEVIDDRLFLGRKK